MLKGEQYNSSTIVQQYNRTTVQQQYNSVTVYTGEHAVGMHGNEGVGENRGNATSIVPRVFHRQAIVVEPRTVELAEEASNSRACRRGVESRRRGARKANCRRWCGCLLPPQRETPAPLPPPPPQSVGFSSLNGVLFFSLFCPHLEEERRGIDVAEQEDLIDRDHPAGLEVERGKVGEEDVAHGRLESNKLQLVLCHPVLTR